MHTTSYASESTTEAPKQKSKLTYDLKEQTQLKHCVAPADIDWAEHTDPKYKLDPNKYLIPALIWGPMNQGKRTHFDKVLNNCSFV